MNAGISHGMTAVQTGPRLGIIKQMCSYQQLHIIRKLRQIEYIVVQVNYNAVQTVFPKKMLKYLRQFLLFFVLYTLEKKTDVLKDFFLFPSNSHNYEVSLNWFKLLLMLLLILWVCFKKAIESVFHLYSTQRKFTWLTSVSQVHCGNQSKYFHAIDRRRLILNHIQRFPILV